MSYWPEYVSHKVVRAAKIVRIDEHSGRNVFVDPGDASLEPFICSQASMHEAAQVGWYAITYPDDFRSASPPDKFEEGYKRKEPSNEGVDEKGNAADQGA